MPKEDPRRQFPQHSKANPGRHDLRQAAEKQKFIASASRGPLKRKSKSKGKA